MTLEIRRFKNTDLSAIVEIWRSHESDLRLPMPVTMNLLEQLVFSKPHFDYDGLLVAVEDGLAVGFAHAAFGPNATMDDLAMHEGVIATVAIHAEYAEPAPIVKKLIAACEDYLQSHGAKVIYGGAVRTAVEMGSGRTTHPFTPFYIGMIGGSEPSGITESNLLLLDAYAQAGYEVIDQLQHFELDVLAFRPLMNPKIATLRRRLTLNIVEDAIPRNWWEAVTLGPFELARLTVDDKETKRTVAMAILRSSEPMRAHSAGHTWDLMEVRVAPKFRKQGVATYVLNEAFRYCAKRGVVRVDTQTKVSDEATTGLLRHFGMYPTTCGRVLRKVL